MSTRSVNKHTVALVVSLFVLVTCISYYSERAMGLSPSTATTTTNIVLPPAAPLQPAAKWKHTVKVENCSLHTRRTSRPGMLIPLQYIHIPKSGGTTIQEALQQWAKPRFRTFLQDGGGADWDCPNRMLTGGKGGMILMGHRGFGFCSKLDNSTEQMAFAVSLREPVSRFRSLFDYIMESNYPQFQIYHKAWKGKPLSQLVVDADKASREYEPGSPELFTYMRFFEFCQQQINFLCGWECMVKATTAGAQSTLTQNEAWLDENLKRALEHLEQCDIVVVMERLDDMIVQFEYQTWNFVPQWVKGKFPEENKHVGRKSELTEEATQILRRWSRHDLILYQAAQQRHIYLTSIAKQCKQ